MGIQINGNTNNINAGIGSLSIEDLNELDIVGVATASNFKTGVSNLHNVGLTLSGGQIDVGSNIKIGTAGVITATSFVGSGANLTGLPAGTTINSNTNNYLITGTGTANTLQGEANLVFTGSKLGINETGPYAELDIASSVEDANNGTLAAHGIRLHHVGATDEEVIPITAAFRTQQDRARAGIGFISKTISGVDGYAGAIGFYTRNTADGNGLYRTDERLRITEGGKTVIGDSDALSSPVGLLHLYQSTNDPYIYIQRGNAGDSAVDLGGIFFRNSANSLASIYARSDDINDGNIIFQTMDNSSLAERVRIDSSGRLHVATGGSSSGVSGNADDIIIGNTSTSNETGITLFSTGASSFRFHDASGTDGAIEYGHTGRTLTFATSNANKMRISSPGASSTSGNAKVSIGALANSAHLNNSTNGDRSTLKVGNYIHLDSGGNGNFTSGMSYNCWPSGNNNFYQGTVTASGGDNRAAAVMMRYGRTEFWGDNSTTGYTAAQQITTMQTNMIVHAAGYVTKPNMPSFFVHGSPSMGTNTGYSNIAYSFSNVKHNTGTHYANNTGRFTAPIAGVYYFCGGLWASMSDQNSGTYLMVFKKNGSEAGVACNHRTYQNQLSASMVISLSANDIITLGYGDGAGGTVQSSTPRNYFCGYLIG